MSKPSQRVSAAAHALILSEELRHTIMENRSLHHELKLALARAEIAESMVAHLRTTQRSSLVVPTTLPDLMKMWSVMERDFQAFQAKFWAFTSHQSEVHAHGTTSHNHLPPADQESGKYSCQTHD
jgi:hypothetical protein